MSSTQTLYDVIFAVVFMVGIAAVMALAYTAAGAMFARADVRAAKSGSGIGAAAQPSEAEQARELVRR
jgi:hypothetical protein